MLQCVAVCCSVLQYVAVRCSVLQCVAVCCSASQCVADHIQKMPCSTTMILLSREPLCVKVRGRERDSKTEKVRKRVKERVKVCVWG